MSFLCTVNVCMYDGSLTAMAADRQKAVSSEGRAQGGRGAPVL